LSTSLSLSLDALASILPRDIFEGVLGKLEMLGKSASYNDFLIPKISLDDNFLEITACEADVSLLLGGSRGFIDEVDFCF